MSLYVSSIILDLIFGDPEWFPHPVRWMGRLIGFFERRLKKEGTKYQERVKGIILVSLVVGISFTFTYLAIVFSERIHHVLAVVVWIYLGYTTLSIKDLRKKAMAVLQEVEKGSLPGARRKVSLIVGRDVQDLTQAEVLTATIESVAENTNDGIAAPLLYLAIGGPALAMVYKAVNTLDSMVGYKNEKYLNFGWCAAKLDDIANYIPARICGLLMVVASSVLRKRTKGALRMMLQDGRKHPSPNSGITEAAMAGALGIRLGGPIYYQGKLLTKSYIGDNGKKVELSSAKEALSISMITSLFITFLGVALVWIRQFFPMGVISIG